MNKVKRKEIIESLNDHEEAIFRIQKALEQHGIRWTDEPKLKVLDQSVFDGLDAKWRFAAVDKDGVASYYNGMPDLRDDEFIYWDVKNGATQSQRLSGKFDATDWQNSLIERDKVELTGSDYYHSSIASKLLERGQKLVVCFVSNVSEADALNKKDIEVITSIDTEFNDADDYGWEFVIPINNQGDPLTAADAGL